MFCFSLCSLCMASRSLQQGSHTAHTKAGALRNANQELPGLKLEQHRFHSILLVKATFRLSPVFRRRHYLKVWAPEVMNHVALQYNGLQSAFCRIVPGFTRLQPELQNAHLAPAKGTDGKEERSPHNDGCWSPKAALKKSALEKEGLFQLSPWRLIALIEVILFSIREQRNFTLLPWITLQKSQTLDVEIIFSSGTCVFLKNLYLFLVLISYIKKHTLTRK